MSERMCQSDCDTENVSERTSDRESVRELVRDHVRDRQSNNIRECVSKSVSEQAYQFYQVSVGSVWYVSAPVLTRFDQILAPHYSLLTHPWNGGKLDQQLFLLYSTVTNHSRYSIRPRHGFAGPCPYWKPLKGEETISCDEYITTNWSVTEMSKQTNILDQQIHLRWIYHNDDVYPAEAGEDQISCSVWRQSLLSHIALIYVISCRLHRAIHNIYDNQLWVPSMQDMSG